MKEFPILKIDDLPKQAKILFSVDYPMFEGDINNIILLDEYVIIWTEYTSKLTGKRKVSQLEFPKDAIQWFVNTIENNYWGNDGDKSSTSEEVVINNESIGVSSMAHCCAENLPGYNFWNRSRKDHVSNLPPQEWDIPRYMLKEGLLEKLRRIT
ncbi:hypothetical protein F9L16_10000 [Agarivorans sp. B2Z047]|uniref:hypothetical protein n=1 Tax=Agarivorans sp. B2Z047 TaxID=2652721 RepID=UPI00128C23E7|nr:hypothetical protein [Agarivorans sp. B2Z047]MPW29329.1 hypothetical protein [Agarivorans sp. B2Z047]UQN44916.1 hypothetical protein LQZ07_10760 [Agarivorans sp. B2Z047]